MMLLLCVLFCFFFFSSNSMLELLHWKPKLPQRLSCLLSVGDCLRWSIQGSLGLKPTGAIQVSWTTAGYTSQPRLSSVSPLIDEQGGETLSQSLVYGAGSHRVPTKALLPVDKFPNSKFIHRQKCLCGRGPFEGGE